MIEVCQFCGSPSSKRKSGLLAEGYIFKEEEHAFADSHSVGHRLRIKGARPLRHVRKDGRLSLLKDTPSSEEKSAPLTGGCVIFKEKSVSLLPSLEKTERGDAPSLEWATAPCWMMRRLKKWALTSPTQEWPISIVPDSRMADKHSARLKKIPTGFSEMWARVSGVRAIPRRTQASWWARRG